MRTTISLDDRLGRAARRRAHEEGLSLSAYIARVLSAALTGAHRPSAPSPFRLITVDGGGTLPGIDLDRSSALLVAEDEALYGRGD